MESSVRDVELEVTNMYVTEQALRCLRSSWEVYRVKKKQHENVTLGTSMFMFLEKRQETITED